MGTDEDGKTNARRESDADGIRKDRGSFVRWPKNAAELITAV